MLSNLLDNALRYGKPGGHVVVEITDTGSPRLGVIDDGPGLSLAEAERVLERFYRVPGSPGDGCGLGLAIVREIADLHLASLRIKPPADEQPGLRVEVTFPS